MSTMDSPGSLLSEHSDDEFQEEEQAYRQTYMSGGASPMNPEPNSTRPAKRQKTGLNHHREIHHGGHQHHGTFDALPPPPPPDEDISSDTDGSVPGSPHMGAATVLPGDEDDGGFGHKGEQISFCRWEGCLAGELGNMDLLVQHLHDEHIHARQKKYSCEWADCTRKGIPHASGYALRAHMRSHTREKPFYCTLPECDRSFTRSDALAKHMRTVHETEALRPSDPVPKHHSSNPFNKHQKLRLTFKAASDSGKNNPPSLPASPLTGPTAVDEDYEHDNVMYVPSGAGQQEYVRQFPPDVHFTEEELALPAATLYRVLRMQYAWASEDKEALRLEIEELDERRRREWTGKELALENLMEGEVVELERRGARGPEDAAMLRVLREDVKGSAALELVGGQLPFWRLPRREQIDGAGGGDVMQGIE